MLEMMIGSRKTTPPRMLRIVPFGERHIFFSPNSSTRCLVGRDRGALDADAVLLGRLGGVDRDLVVGGVAVLDRQVEVLQVDVEVGQDQLVLDEGPDDARHLVAVHLDDGVGHLDLGHGARLGADASFEVSPFGTPALSASAAASSRARNLAADGLRLDAGAAGAAPAGPRGRRRRRRPLRPAQRLVDQRLLARVRQGDGRPRLDRADVAGRARRWRAAGRSTG